MKWLLVLIPIVLFTGCSLKSKLVPDLNLLKVQAEEMNALKNQVDDMQNDLKANASAVAGINNKSSQSNTAAGRDMINDSEVIKGYIEANKALNEKVLDTYKALTNKYIWLLYSIIGTMLTGLFGLLTKYELQIRNINKRLLDSRDKDDETEDRLLEKLIKAKGVK